MHYEFLHVSPLSYLGTSVAQIITNTSTNQDIDLSWCELCKELNNHEKKENWIILASVLIIALERFEESLSTQVDPTKVLVINDASYELKAVISHRRIGAISNHLTTSLYNKNDDSWTECDDQDLKDPSIEKPMNGFVFIYDKIDNVSSLTSPLNQSNLENNPYDLAKNENVNPLRSNQKREESDDDNISQKYRKRLKTPLDKNDKSVECKGCQKEFKSLCSHFAKVEKTDKNCKEAYDSEEMEEIVAESNKKKAASKKKNIDKITLKRLQHLKNNLKKKILEMQLNVKKSTRKITL